MKLMCHKCEKINRYTIWEIAKCEYFGSKILLCKNCGYDTSINNTTATIIARAIIVSTILVINFFLYLEYKGEISSLLVGFIANLLIALALYFILMPLYAFLLCFANNCVRRISHSKQKIV